MAVDWKKLAPHRPIDAGDPLYVERPEHGAKRIADLVRSGQSTLLVVGPVGIGKSTELAQAAKLLQSDRAAFLIQLDRVENMHRVAGDQVLLRVAHAVAELAERQLGVALSSELREALGLSQSIASSGVFGVSVAFASPPVLLNAALAEISRHAGRPLTLLLDGLEKTTEEHADSIFGGLAEIDEQVELVLVVPWHAAFGPRAQQVVRPAEKLVPLRPTPMGPWNRAPGVAFLRELLLRRLGLPTGALPATPFGTVDPSAPPATFAQCVAEAAVMSGGIPRTFLQLMADAASYARLDRNAEWPGLPDLASAMGDQMDTLRRLLLPGDTAAIQQADGTEGRELDLPRKLRLLQHGMLIEQMENNRAVMRIHPLVRQLFDRSPRG